MHVTRHIAHRTENAIRALAQGRIPAIFAETETVQSILLRADRVIE